VKLFIKDSIDHLGKFNEEMQIGREGVADIIMLSIIRLTDCALICS
jgi:hypothetical protein